MTTMTNDHTVILGAVARRTDPEDEQPNPGASIPLPGFAPRLVLAPGKSYDVRLSFFLHVILPEGQVSVAPFYEIAGERVMGEWVESVAEGEAPGRGLIRGEPVFRNVASPDGSLIVGLLIQGAGGYTVGHLMATAWDPALADHIVTGHVELYTDTIRR